MKSRKLLKKFVSISLVVMLLCGLSVSESQIMNQQEVEAATFDDINQASVFQKQASGSVTCTLVSASMMLRRVAMMAGNTNWNSITENTIYSSAWLEGSGLLHNFTYNGMTVTSQLVYGNTATMINLLKEHPEGIVAYGTNSQGGSHAILLTDYQNGTFYCADPSPYYPSGRIPVAQASIALSTVTRVWYVSSPDVNVEEGNAPIGYEDMITGGDGSIYVKGWAFDWDDVNANLEVHVYIGGPAGSGAECHIIKADKIRTDVNDIYNGAGNKHGYEATIKTNMHGSQPIYIYAINVGGGRAYSTIGFQTVSIASDPIGYMDTITGGDGSIYVKGWAFDWDDVSTSLEIHVYIGGPVGSGAECHVIKADKTRTDVNEGYKGVGDNHGYEATIKTDMRGNQPIHIYAINVGGGSNNGTIGYKVVNITSSVTTPTVSSEPIPSKTPSTATQSPSVSSTSTPQPSKSIKGDVDGNGSVELTDAQMALKAALKIENLSSTQKNVADVDENAVIELLDAQWILKVALKITSFDVL